MEYTFFSFKMAFERGISEGKRFPVYTFILAGDADTNIFPDLVAYHSEMHHLTGEDMLVIAPNTILFNSQHQIISDPEEISRHLSRGKTYSNHDGQEVDIADDIEKFLKRQTKESYEFARFVGIELNKFPCALFFDTLQDPQEYVLWPIKRLSAQSFIQEFREVIDCVRESLAEGKHNVLDKINDKISTLALKKFGRQVLQSLKLSLPHAEIDLREFAKASS